LDVCETRCHTRRQALRTDHPRRASARVVRWLLVPVGRATHRVGVAVRAPARCGACRSAGSL